MYCFLFISRTFRFIFSSLSAPPASLHFFHTVSFFFIEYLRLYGEFRSSFQCQLTVCEYPGMQLIRKACHVFRSECNKLSVLHHQLFQKSIDTQAARLVQLDMDHAMIRPIQTFMQTIRMHR